MTQPSSPAPSPARRGRPPKAAGAPATDTRATILDAAEDLFSKHGFYGVTIREVAREAGVDTALVHYYFGAKRELFDAVFLRRAEVWNNDRVDAINRYVETAGSRGDPGGAAGSLPATAVRMVAEGRAGLETLCRPGGPDQRQPDLRRRDHGPLFRPRHPSADRTDPVAHARGRRTSISTGPITICRAP
jgi:AcrR family transcriptional regulator